VQSVEGQPTFRKNFLPQSLGSKNKPKEEPSMKQVASEEIRLP
jgi:hypothetical protein